MNLDEFRKFLLSHKKDIKEVIDLPVTFIPTTNNEYLYRRKATLGVSMEELDISLSVAQSAVNIFMQEEKILLLKVIGENPEEPCSILQYTSEIEIELKDTKKHNVIFVTYEFGFAKEK